jgi:hypothetical protein
MWRGGPFGLVERFREDMSDVLIILCPLVSSSSKIVPILR